MPNNNYWFYSDYGRSNYQDQNPSTKNREIPNNHYHIDMVNLGLQVAYFPQW